MPTPLRVKTHYSLCEGFYKSEDISSLCGEACAITDRDTLSGVIDFKNSMSKAEKKGIIGIDLRISEGDNRVLLLCKTLKGYYSLVKLLNTRREGYVHWQNLKNTEDLICLTQEENESFTKFLQSHFGDDLYIELQYGNGNIDKLRELGKCHSIPCVATSDINYSRPQDKFDHQTLIAIGLGSKFRDISKVAESKGRPDLLKYFDELDRSFLSAGEQISDTKYFTGDEIGASDLIKDKCENVSIFRQPAIPKFPNTPERHTPASYLRQLCVEGWKKKIVGRIPPDKLQDYGNRVKEELDIMIKFGLSDYFLVVADIVNWAKSNKILVGPGRGSCGGSMISYLTNITAVDPIKYNLLLSRFINYGRFDLASGHISLPDIDCDFPIHNREDVIKYIIDVYGMDNVCQVITFSNLKGRGAIKYVFSTHDVCSFDQTNKICEGIPEESKISGELQEMGDDRSIIRWAMQNNSSHFKKWVKIDKDGNIQGDWAPYFEQAIRLEGTKHHYGKHAAGIIVSNETLADIVPMRWDEKSKKFIVEYEYEDGEKCGLCKIDILGVAILDKIMGVINANK